MKTQIKILLLWTTSLVIYFFIITTLSHRTIELVSIVNTGIQFLLFLLAIWTALDLKGSQRYLYYIFALFFLYIILLVIDIFAGEAFWTGSRYPSFYYHVYVTKIGMNFILLFTVAYAIFEGTFPRASKLWLKYTLSGAAATILLLLLFSPFIFQPLALKTQPEYVTLLQMGDSQKRLQSELKREPTMEELLKVAAVGFQNDSGIEKVNANNDSHEKVKALYPYLNSEGIKTIFWKPINQISIYVNLIVVIAIGLFLWYLFRSKKPQGAYLDKIMILFFALSMFEMLHNYGLNNTAEFDAHHTVFVIGQWFTIFCFLSMVLVFELKLRFVSSVTGAYYERMLVEAPDRVTRWRDEFDTYVLHTFFNKNKLINRMAQMSTHQEKTKGN